jgi:beta-lactamase class A
MQIRSCIWSLIVAQFLQASTCSAQAIQSRLPTGVEAGLPEDHRLERMVTVNQIGIPLIELLQQVSSKELELSCSRQCAQQKLQIRLKDRKLRSLMEGLAELMPGEWKSLLDKSGYRFEMDEEAVRRRDRWWKLFLNERERAMAARRRHVLEIMRSEPFRRNPGEPNPEGSDPTIERQRAFEHDFFRGLPAGLQERIAAELSDTPFYMLGGPGASSEENEGAIALPFGSLTMGSQETLRKSVSAAFFDSATLDFANATVTIMNSGIFVSAGVEFPDGRRSGAAFSLHASLSGDFWVAMLDQTRLVKEVERLGTHAPEAWRQLAAYQKSAYVREGGKLKAELDGIADGFHGVLGYSLHHLKRNETIERRGDELFPTASTIKLAVLCTAMDKNQKGEIGYFETRPLTKEFVRGGAGFLQNYKEGTKVELKELLHLMITVSDNTATAMMVRWLTAMEVNGWLDRHGLKQTRLLSQLPEGETALRKLSEQWGLGVTTPNEMRTLMEMILDGRAGTPAACDEMHRILNHQYFDNLIAGEAPPWICVASKSGAIDESRSDVAIVHSPSGDYVLAVYTKQAQDQKWSRENEGEQSIRAIARAVWRYYNPKVKWSPPPGVEKF